MSEYNTATFFAIILAALFFGVGCYSYGYRRREKGKGKWSNKPLGKLAVAFLLAGGLMCGAAPVDAGTRTVSWTAVTQYTDGTAIESTNTPVTYDVWYVTPAGTKVAVATGTSATSAQFSDAGMTRGAVYNFSGRAYTKDGSASADATAYGWTVPFQIPKAPTTFTVQ